PIASRWSQRVRRVVQRMRPRVGALHLQTVAQPMSQFQLHRVVARIRARSLIERLKQGVVSDRIEGENREVTSVVQGLSRNISGRTSKGIRRITAVRYETGNQIRIRWVPINLPIDPTSLGADVSNIQAVVPWQFPLDSEIPIVAGGIPEVSVENNWLDQASIRNNR